MSSPVARSNRKRTFPVTLTYLLRVPAGGTGWLWQQDRNEPYPVPDYSVLTLWYDDVLGKDFRARLLTLPLGAWVASVILGPSLLPNFSSNFIGLSVALARVLLLPPT